MNDREMLVLAARAAGQERSFAGDPWSSARGRLWDPLNDDGDALRLAVKLGLNVDVYRQEPLRETPCVEVRGYVYRRSLAIEQAADNGASLEAATRRAIVRAAAAIGEKT